MPGEGGTLEGLLEDVLVLDLAHDMAGSLCARLMGDYGAEVIKVEPPGGVGLRRVGPFYRDDPHPERSLTYFALNLNKMGVTLDLETEGGRHLLLRLAGMADVVVESFTPGYLDSLGLGHATLAQRNPGLVLTSITPFGQTGPYRDRRGEEIVSEAMGGAMSLGGTRDREPLKHGGAQAQYQAGFCGAAATAMALFQQQVTGLGQHVDVSEAECVATTMAASQARYAFTGAIDGRRPPLGGLGVPVPCQDGWVIAQAGGPATWEDWVAFYRRPELLDPRFEAQVRSGRYGDDLDALVTGALKDRGKQDLFQEASELGLLFGVVQTPRDLAQCPQLQSRGFYRDTDHPVMGRLSVPAVAFDAGPDAYRLERPAPLLGQHNEEVYCARLGYGRQDLVRLRQAGVI